MLPNQWTFNHIYEFRIVESLKKDPSFQGLIDILGGAPPLDKMLSEEEKSNHDRLRSAETGVRFRLGVYCGSELIAFTYAFQIEGSNLHMAMSCVHPAHRRKGIYKELIRATIQFSKDSGFQTVDSYHRSTNNSVIIAKLQNGFVINGMTLSDLMGCLVRLTYFHNSERRKLQEVRSGMIRPDALLRELFF